MKLLPFVLIVTLLVPATLGISWWDQIQDWTNKGKKYVDQGIVELKYAGAVVIHGAQETAEKVRKAFNDFKVQASEKFEELYNNAKHGIDELSGKMEVLGAKIQKLTDKGAKHLLETLIGYVNKTESTLQFELSKLDRQVEVPARRAIDNVMEELDNLRDWGDKQINAVDDQHRLKVLAAVHEILNHTHEKLKECSDATIVPIEDVFRSANETLKEVMDTVRGLIQSVETCTDDDKSIVSRILDCGQSVACAAEKAIVEVKDITSNLLNTVEEVTNDSKHALGCFKDVFDMEANKQKIKDAAKQTLEQLKDTFIPAINY